MSRVPRQRRQASQIPVGPEGALDFVEAGQIDSLLVSQSHYRTGFSWSGGGPFFQVTDSIDHLGRKDFPEVKLWFKTQPVYHACGVVPCPTRLPRPLPATYLENWDSQTAYNQSFVASGFRRTRPGNPIASVGQFLIELRDLPKLPFQGRHGYKSVFSQGFSLGKAFHYLRSYASDFRHLGGEYLNYTFGWRPFVNDLQKAYNLWQTIDKRMADIIRNNGKGIRRRATVSNTSEILGDESSTFPWAGANVYGFPGFAVGSPNTTYWRKVRRKTERVWYSAKYRYYIPDVSSSQWTSRARLALFGALPTPELVWEVIPFSWLIDWAVNVQDVVSNMSANAVDNLVQEYSFVMRETSYETEYTAITSWTSYYDIPAGSHTFRSIERQTMKTRSYGGSPYALNTVNTPLTAYQAGVLAALGLSRM